MKSKQKFVKKRNIILSIKPIWVEKILEGRKTVELRRRFPLGIAENSRIFIYETSPVRAISSTALIGRVLKMSPDLIWDIFSGHSCVNKDFFDSYFNGCERGFVIPIKEARPLKKAISLTTLRLKFNIGAPQSFSYAHDELSSMIFSQNDNI